MASNAVPLQSDGSPTPLHGEEVCSTEEVEFEVLSGTGYPGSSGCFFTASAKLYTSNLRLVVVPNRQSAQFSSFSLPLYLIQRPTLTTPMLGKASVKGVVESIRGFGLTGPGKFTLSFTKKQLAVYFFQLLEGLMDRAQQTRLNGGPDAVGHSTVCNPRPQPIDGSVSQQTLPPLPAYEPPQPAPHSPDSAYVDSSDPTLLFLPVHEQATEPLVRTSFPQREMIPQHNAAADTSRVDSTSNRSSLPDLGSMFSRPRLSARASASSMSSESTPFMSEQSVDRTLRTPLLSQVHLDFRGDEHKEMEVPQDAHASPRKKSKEAKTDQETEHLLG